MIDIDNWMRELEEEEDIEIKNNEEYQTKLFEEYVLRGSDHQEERRKLNERYLSGEELILENFLRNLKKGIDVDGNWVNIVVGEADWVEEGDSILKAKVAVQFDITFEGGIYQDRDIKPMDIGSVG